MKAIKMVQLYRYFMWFFVFISLLFMDEIEAKKSVLSLRISSSSEQMKVLILFAKPKAL